MKTLLLGLVFLVIARSARAQEAESSSEFKFTLNGVEIRQDDFRAHLGGYFTLDAIHYSYANERSSGLALDRGMLIFDGQVGERFAFRIEPDLVGVDTLRHLYEAWGQVTADEALRVTAGQMRVALGSELATWPFDFPVLGYGFHPYLAGIYDIGGRLDGGFFEDQLWYEATGTIGEGFDLEGLRREAPRLVLRLGGELARDGFFKGFFFGFGFAHDLDGDERVVLVTPLEQVVFTSPNLDGNSASFQHTEFGWFRGPFRVGVEITDGEVTDVPVPSGGKVDIDQLGAYDIYAAWVLTGQKPTWRRGRWQPMPSEAEPDAFRVLDVPGVVELAARHSNADIDRTLFDEGITTYDPSTQEVRTFTLNLSWRPKPTWRASLGWVKTIADHELTTFGGTNRDSSLFLRFEVTF